MFTFFTFCVIILLTHNYYLLSMFNSTPTLYHKF
nr:MAG TPA: hypothetical protein [Caudoviricetes sp.]